MTKTERKVMQPNEELIGELLRERNEGTEDCLLSSDLARTFGISAQDLNLFLIDKGVLLRDRKNRILKLTKEYEGRGYAKMRSHFHYSRLGELIEARFPVWTEKGQEFIKDMINGKRLKS